MRGKPLTEELELPWPPSVNAVYRTKAFKSRKTGKLMSMPILSQEGRDYFEKVRKLMLERRPINFGKVRLKAEILVFAVDERRRDLGNLDKILMDSLQKAGVFENDCQIDDQRFIRGRKCAGELPRVIVTLTEILPDNRPACLCGACKAHYGDGELFVDTEG